MKIWGQIWPTFHWHQTAREWTHRAVDVVEAGRRVSLQDPETAIRTDSVDLTISGVMILQCSAPDSAEEVVGWEARTIPTPPHSSAETAAESVTLLNRVRRRPWMVDSRPWTTALATLTVESVPVTNAAGKATFLRIVRALEVVGIRTDASTVTVTVT